MSIEPKELTPGQESLLARAHAVTLEQFKIARHLAESEFPTTKGSPSDQVVLAIAQILASNYLATVTRQNG